MGKSSLALDFALNAPSCYFISLEMSEKQLQERALCNIAGLNHHRITLGKFEKGDKDRLKKAATILENKNLMIEDSINIMYPADYTQIYKGKPMPSPSINGLVDKAANNYHAKLIVIDYLQLIKFGMYTEREDLRIHKITWELHELTKKHNIPIVLLSQLKRFETDRYYEGKGKKCSPKPRLDDLRDSGSIEQDADIVLLLHRPSYYDKEEEVNIYDDIVEDDAIIICAKNRSGPTGDINLSFHTSEMSWKNFEGMSGGL